MVLIIGPEDIEKIVKRLGYRIMDTGKISYLLSKIKSMKPSNDIKKDISKIASNIWFQIISLHPCVDGNKRTATETMQLFLILNNSELNIPPNGLIYISLKIANNDIDLNKLTQLIYEKLEVKK